MVDRRQFIKKASGTLAALGGLSLFQRSGLATARSAEESIILDALPSKKALIKKTYRPPNYETPISYFDAPFTPNNLFFVRYHNAVIPEVKAGEWRLRIGGDAVRTPLELALLNNSIILFTYNSMC
jgi:DMSO/TMAO reductase YedYZ molybdopterin-dependent catalytic subunit